VLGARQSELGCGSKPMIPCNIWDFDRRCWARGDLS